MIAKEILYEIKNKHNIETAWQLTEHIIIEAMEEYAKQQVKINNIPHDSKNYFHSVIKKLPHSEGRVPYTYHHDYLRINVEKFKGSSRSEVAMNHNENDVELYAVALTQILNELNFRNTMDLNEDDIIICKEAIQITDDIVNRYNSIK